MKKPIVLLVLAGLLLVIGTAACGTAAPKSEAVPPTIGVPSDPVSVAQAYLRQHGPEYRLANPDQEMNVLAVTRDSGLYSRTGVVYVRMQQVYKNLPIFGVQVIVHMKGDPLGVVSVGGSTVRTPGLPVSPSIAGEAARSLAIRNMPEASVRERQDGAYPESGPRLGIFVETPFTGYPGSPRLAYEVETLGVVTYVDALDGRILLQYDNVKTERTRETYSAGNTSRLPGTLLLTETAACDSTNAAQTPAGKPVLALDYNADGAADLFVYYGPGFGVVRITGTNGAPGGLSSGSDACRAHSYAKDTYDYFWTVHGRDSYDDAGGKLISSVNYFSSACPNAGWTGSQMFYCTGFALSEDVAVHELTHAVTDNSSDLIYLNQSGALNESYADVFAVMVDRQDWLIGEDLPNLPACGAVRNLADPAACGDPDHMDGYLTRADPPCKGTTDEASGCIHFNSSIPSKAAWLLANGGTFRGVTVTGIGRTKVEHIYYLTLIRLPPGAQFSEAARETQQACNDLVGQFGITKADCAQVRNAFRAVGIDFNDG